MNKTPLVIICIILLLISCSPVPLIQSPRIKPGLSVSSSIKTSYWKDVTYELTRSKEKFNTSEVLPAFFSIGIKNRLEFSAMAFPYLYYGYLVSGNAKVNIFEIGKKNFKNLAASAFSGANGYEGEHEDEFNYYGGVSCGTMAATKHLEIEFVLQSSYSVEKRYSHEYKENYRIEWVQPAIGMSFHPINVKPFDIDFDIIHINLGVNYSYPIKSRVRYRDYFAEEDHVLINSAAGGMTFLGEVKLQIF